MVETVKTMASEDARMYFLVVPDSLQIFDLVLQIHAAPVCLLEQS